MHRDLNLQVRGRSDLVQKPVATTLFLPIVLVLQCLWLLTSRADSRVRLILGNSSVLKLNREWHWLKQKAEGNKGCGTTQEGAVGLKSACSCLVRCVWPLGIGGRMVFLCIMPREVLSPSCTVAQYSCIMKHLISSICHQVRVNRCSQN